MLSILHRHTLALLFPSQTCQIFFLQDTQSLLVDKNEINGKKPHIIHNGNINNPITLTITIDKLVFKQLEIHPQYWSYYWQTITTTQTHTKMILSLVCSLKFVLCKFSKRLALLLVVSTSWVLQKKTKYLQHHVTTYKGHNHTNLEIKLEHKRRWLSSQVPSSRTKQPTHKHIRKQRS